MPVKVEMRDSLHRLVEVGSGRIAVTENGVAKDGGGHVSKNKARRQAAHINTAEAKKP